MRKSRVAVFGVPLDHGASRRGVDMGPSAIRYAEIDRRIESLDYVVKDHGNIIISDPACCELGSPKTRYLAQITEVSLDLSAAVLESVAQGCLPLVLGGDHSVAIGTISGVAEHFRQRRQSAGLIWIDSQAELDTPESSTSGDVNGMSLACIVGRGPSELTHIFSFAPKIEPKNVAVVGLRYLGELDVLRAREFGMHIFTMRDIDQRGISDVMSDAIGFATEGTAGIHVSLDMKALDPKEAPGVSHPLPGGLTFRAARLAMEMICDTGALASIDIVEVNPIHDVANRTADLAVHLATAAFGRRIP